MRTLNLGILAHVDAGKTTLTERLLFAAGAIDEIGRVDHGSTQTDTLALERQRGITIKSAVVAFTIDDVVVDLIDTPGHPDFIAEVERVLAVLDGVVLVISAVEGVQAQTRVLMRTLRRLDLPTLIFVNKTDRAGADPQRVVRAIADTLTPSIVAMGSTRDPGTPASSFAPFGEADDGFRTALVDRLAEHDDAILADAVGGNGIADRRLRRAFASQTRRALVHPVFLGSAVTGAGVPELMAGIAELLPAAAGDVDGDPSGLVFKIERGPAGEKIALVRMFSGTIRTRDRLRVGGRHEQRVTGIAVFDEGGTVERGSVGAGRIAKVRGLVGARIGDVIGVAPTMSTDGHHFAPPTLEAVVDPLDPSRRGALRAALEQLAEQDPLIHVRQDDSRRELAVSLYGEVQKEVIGATFALDYGVEVAFRETTTVCIERVTGTGEAVDRIDTPPDNPFLAGIGLRVGPAPVGSGVSFELGIELGSVPLAFLRAVEETVRVTLRQGLRGWDVPDARVTIVYSQYWPRQSHSHGTFDKSMSSTAGDFRQLTPLVLMEALRRAGTAVCEPIDRFALELPVDTLGAVAPALARLGAVPVTQELRGSTAILEGDVSAARVHELRQQLPALTRGEGVLECALDHYRPVRGPSPARSRTDHNPLDRKEYLLRVTRRV